MTENQSAHGASTGAAADDYAPLLPNQVGSEADAASENEHEFATEAEEDSYWAGVADGIRQLGGTVPPRLAARAAKEQLLVQWHGGEEEGPPPAPPAKAGGEFHRTDDSPPRLRGGAGGGPSFDPPSSNPAPSQSGDILDFTPVPVAHRSNGWTPEKQVAFVEALADTGVIRAAAARVGMTEQSAGWLRRRADARAFDLACTAALRIGARRILSIAYERAIEGTVKRHYFHGELKAEERVYDNRLLIALLSRMPVAAEPDPAAQAIEHNWDQWMDAIEQGAPPPAPAPAPVPAAVPAAAAPGSAAEPHPQAIDPATDRAAPAPSNAGSLGPDPDALEPRVWQDGEDWLTNCPPPPGFDLYAEFEPGDPHYQRLLTPGEEQYWEETGAEAVDAAGGYDGDFFYYLDRPDIFPWGYENSEKLGQAAAEPPGGSAEQAQRAQAAAGDGEGPADGSASAEPDRRRGFAATPPAAAAEPQEERSEASDTCGESRPGPADGSASAEPDRRRGFAATPPDVEAPPPQFPPAPAPATE